MRTLAFPYLGDLLKAFGVQLPLPLPTYGLMVALALLISTWIGYRELKRLQDAGRIGLAQARNRGKDSKSAQEPVPLDKVVVDLVTLVTAVGLIGARIFHILEHPQEFVAHPFDMIFSRSGFSYYGGLILGTLSGAIYVRWRRLPLRIVLDAIAPVLMLAYGIARIGCQLSGDGDWGIPADFSIKPDWIPAWLWGQTYENNVSGVRIAQPGVYPTPIYETLMSFIGFAILWSMRDHPFRPGWLFALYLVLAGIERLLIEPIRVNVVFQVFGINATQAEMVSVVLVVLGIVGIAILSHKEEPLPQRPIARRAKRRRK
ncbi:MAG: prolipoprotein diacylglyceryl transferase family protein [Thiobacillaceae bacterium]